MPRRAVPFDPSIGDRIRARRNSRRWSIRHAADRAGIAHTTWSRIERGELRSDRYMIAEIAAALECSVVDLTGQPYVPGDRALESAHAHMPPLWRALVEIAPDEPPSRPGREVRDLATTVELVSARRLAGDYAAVSDLLPGLLGDLHAASDGPEWRPALRLLVDALHTTVLTVRHLGYVVEPTLAAERCRQAAERLGEPVPLAVGDWTRAHAAASAGSFSRSHTLASRAADELAAHLGDPGAREVLGMLHLTDAVAILANKRVNDARGLVDEAAALAEATGETDTWTMQFGPANVGVWRMQIEVDSGAPGRAVEIAAEVDTGRLSPARRSSFHVEVARGLVDVKRDQDAIAHLLSAERTAPQFTRSSLTARETARFLLNRAQRAVAATGLVGLCERMGVAA